MKDACVMLDSETPVKLESTTHLAAHLLREIESSVRRVLQLVTSGKAAVVIVYNRDLVADHVHTTLHDEKVQWQPLLEGALRGLSAAQAASKPASPRHSIWRIVCHVTL